jgi:hypothetical protein
MKRVFVTGKQGGPAPRLDRVYRRIATPLVAPKRASSTPSVGVAGRALILVTFVLLTFPPCFFGGMQVGIDGSWAIGLNVASDQHMVFGRDIAFTYGPLGFVIAPHDFGSNLLHMVILRIGLHLFWWTSVGVLLFRTRAFLDSLLFASASVLSGVYFGPNWDVNFQLTGVINLTVMGYLVLGLIDRRAIWGVPAAIIAAAAMLAKFNIGVACAGAIAVWAVIQLYREPSPRMLSRLGLVALTYVGILVALFRIYGGPIGALGDFFKYSREIASGYSSQMSSAGPVSELVAVSAVLGIAVLGAVAGILTRARYTPVLLIILFPLFVLYKGAITRHDAGHFLTSCPVIVGLFAFQLPVRSGRWYSGTSRAIVVLALLGVSWFAPLNVLKICRRGVSSLVAVCKYEQSQAIARAQVAKVNDQLRLPPAFLARIGPAPMDVYPWDISVAVANGLNWKPRFVFQSYTAYTPVLDRKSAESFRAEDAPEYVLYSFQAIDAQHPCIVDPRTWSEIFRRYRVVDQANDMLLLKRGDSPRRDQVQWLGSYTTAFGDRWEIPEDIDGQVFLQAKLKLSLFGRLMLALYKVYPPVIRVEYRDGSIANHRLVWRNVESGILVSSLPRSLDGVRELLERGQADRVRAVSFRQSGTSFEKVFRVSWFRASTNPGPRPREFARRVAAISPSPTTRK